MSPRVTSNDNVFFVLLRFIPSLTFVPFSPRSIFLISVFGMFMPATAESFIVIIRSPAIRPIFSDGPPGITSFTVTVSVSIVNDMPMPLNEPSRSSLTASSSLAGI